LQYQYPNTLYAHTMFLVPSLPHSYKQPLSHPCDESPFWLHRPLSSLLAIALVLHLTPSFLLFSYLSQSLTSPSILDDLIWNGSPPGYGLRYGPSLHCPSTSRFPDPWNLPSIGSHLSWFIPIPPLFLFWNLGQITSTFWLNVGTYPPCLRYPHHAYPSSRITWKCRITSDNPGPLAQTTSIFVVSPFTLYPAVHIGTIIVLS